MAEEHGAAVLVADVDVFGGEVERHVGGCTRTL